MTTPARIGTDTDHAEQGAGTGLVVAFLLAGQRYALPIERVQEIQQIVAFSEVPTGTNGVVGMVNLRGEVIPAVDIRMLVGLAPKQYTLDTPMIIARAGDALAALIVDEVQDVVSLPPGGLQDPPALHSMADRLVGVAHIDGGVLSVLDLDRLFERESGETGAP